MKRFLTAFALAFALAICLAPGLALAAESNGGLAGGSVDFSAQDATSYDLWVGNVEVTSANAPNIKGDGVSGKVSYDASTNTLTLNGATIDGVCVKDSYYYRSGDPVPFLRNTGCGIYQSGTDTLTVRLIGANKLNFAYDGRSDSFAIAVAKTDGDLVFAGTGSLEITSKVECYGRGIGCKNLVVDSGATVKSSIAMDNRKETCYAVDAGDSVTVAGTLSASATTSISENAYGLRAETDLVVKKGGKLTASAQGSSYVGSIAFAIRCYGTFSVAGTLTAKAEGLAAYGLSVNNGGSVAKDGKLTISAKSSWQEYPNALDLDSGNVTVNGTAKITSNTKGIGSDSNATVTVGKTGDLAVDGAPAFENVTAKLGSSALKVLTGFGSSSAKPSSVSDIGDARYVRIYAPKANPMTAKAKTVKFKVAKVKQKAQSVKASKAFTVKNAKGAVSYKATSITKNATKYVSVAKNGKVTVKKGTKKGTYKLKVKVKAAGNDNYKSGSKTVTLTVKVVK